MSLSTTGQVPFSRTSPYLKNPPEGVPYIDLTMSDEEGEQPPPKRRRCTAEVDLNLEAKYPAQKPTVNSLKGRAKMSAEAGKLFGDKEYECQTEFAASKRKHPAGDRFFEAEEFILRGMEETSDSVTFERFESGRDTHTDAGEGVRAKAEKEWGPTPASRIEAVGGTYSAIDDMEETEQEGRLAGDEAPIILTPAQQAVVEMAVKGHNIFLTGAAGSGKTATLTEIQRRLKRMFKDGGTSLYPKVQVVAPTGIAALPLNGKTTFSFAGWNPDAFQKPLDDILNHVQLRIKTAMNHLKVLIIEEISMVENQFLERLNLLMQHVLNSDKPFGGKQVIFLGDFHQIPPVKPFQFCINCGEPMKTPEVTTVCVTSDCPLRTTAFRPGDKWAFKAPVWEDLKLKHVKLEQIHRQKDSSFQAVLNKIRNGISLTAEEWNAVTAKKTLPPRAFQIRLMSLKRKVEDFNGRQLSSIDKLAVRWEALDLCGKLRRVEGDEFRQNDIEKATNKHRDSLKQYHRFPTWLALKVGAKVVMLSNLSHESGLVNGSQGEIVGFADTKDWAPALPEERGLERYNSTTTTPNARNTNKDERAIASPKQKKSDRQLRAEEAVAQFRDEKGSLCPIVRFTNGVTKTIHPVAEESLKGSSQDRYRVCRTQIPLALAWALSIHKSQGMTLQHVELSSEDIFESGQLYVGMSRATTLNGLTVTGYSRTLLAVDEDVLEFYKRAKWENLGPSNKSMT